MAKASRVRSGWCIGFMVGWFGLVNVKAAARGPGFHRVQRRRLAGLYAVGENSTLYSRSFSLAQRCILVNAKGMFTGVFLALAFLSLGVVAFTYLKNA